MVEQLYSEYPELYDAIQSEWDYDRDVAFVTERLDARELAGTELLEVGCGTGEHTKRFVDAGFDVTAVEPNEGMLSLAREKTDATFHTDGLPGFDIGREFDVILAIRGVINHLVPGELGPAIETLETHLAPGGVLVFDNSPLPPEGNEAALDVGTYKHGQYARVVQMTPIDTGQLSWDSLVFTPDGEFFIDSYDMTPFEDVTIAATLSQHGLAVETVAGYGPDDSRTVFVAG
ncbi:class I SAM-dependent DNA methyltransferase [Halovenus salina]|uniref:Class I SAM-dependent DNA methyltransferase n=2 Tax=Halovenus salina TaxID=1510225 RepID=A0ABD5VVI4_9EURY